MNLDYLPFEQEIAKADEEIAAIRQSHAGTSESLSAQIKSLEEKNRRLTKELYSSLNIWQQVQVARHPKRPYVLDYIPLLFTDFQELHGDRHFADDGAIVGGLANLEGKTVMVVGHQKGRSTDERITRHFGMPRPEGYRKAARLFKMAGKFHIPIITFIDTAGAYVGIAAEERNQSEAIAHNLQLLASLPTPVICIVTGEGGSGGALAIGVGDRIAMLQYSIYSVISPEGCASILWRDSKHSALAAEAMGVTAKDIARLNLIDAILPEPLGGAHRDPKQMASTIKAFLLKELEVLKKVPVEQLIKQREMKLLRDLG